MPTLSIGRTRIDYELRRSASALERRITVTPERIEVLALTDDNDDAISGFLDRKRQWILNTVREVSQIAARRHAVPRFMSGSKIPFRGRRMPLTVRRSDAERMEITYRNGFVVDLPSWAGDDTDGLVAGETEIRRGGPSYTADTLRSLAEKYPGCTLFTIVGDDAAAGITTWERYDEVVERSSLVVVDRPGAPVSLPSQFEWIHVEVPHLEVSSTDLRSRVTDGRPLDYLLTGPVLRIVQQRSLYREAA